MGSFTDKAKGRIKQAAGSLTGDKGLKREGEKDEATGKVKEVVEDVKEAARDVKRAVKKAVE